jgi:hypothetical protein
MSPCGSQFLGSNLFPLNRHFLLSLDGRISDISVRRLAELIVPLTVGQAFANVG